MQPEVSPVQEKSTETKQPVAEIKSSETPVVVTKNPKAVIETNVNIEKSQNAADIKSDAVRQPVTETKTIAENKIEVKKRTSDVSELLSKEEALGMV